MTPLALPAPFSWAAWAGLAVVKAGAWWLTVTTRNVGWLGPWWAVAYWLSVWGLWRLGGWGGRRMRSVRAGNDAWEYDPTRRGATWLGRAASVIRLQVAGEAWIAATATAVGYGGFAALLVAGLAGAWLAVVVGSLLLAKALEVRRRRNPWWT